MKKPGFEVTAKAVLPYFVGAEIYPPLDELGEDGDEYNHRFIEINTNPSYHTHDVVTTLDNAGLLEGSLRGTECFDDMPILRIIGIMPGRVLLEDLAYHPIFAE